MANPKRTNEPAKLTKRTVDAAKPRDREYMLWDSEIKGFGLKILPSGRKTYLLKYRTRSGLPRKPQIGVHGDITPDKARDIASDWRADIAKGGDPSLQRRESRQTGLSRGSTFHEVVDEFIEKYARRRQRTWQETERTLKTNCAEWLNRPITTITKADVYGLLDGFVASGKEAKARVTYAWLKTLFRWAVKRDIVESSIIEGVEIEIERKVRQRFYSDSEVRAIWGSAQKLDPLQAGFVKLNILLGVRKGELAGMRRNEFDDPTDPTLWIVPHARTKTRKSQTRERVYIVPLPKLAQRVLKSLPKLDEDLIFPGQEPGKPMVSTAGLCHLVREHSGVKDWTHHACRDTVATWLKDQGHSEYERGLVLNHSESSVTADYSHGYPVDLKRELLEKWARHVEGLVQPEGAVLLS